MTDLTRLLAHDMADGLRRGDFSARELTDAHLAAIEKTDRPLHAWVYVDAGRCAGTGRRRRQGTPRRRAEFPTNWHPGCAQGSGADQGRPGHRR